MRRGPTLTGVLYDPARGTAVLRAATEKAVRLSRLPASVEAGAEEGLVQLHLWAGDLGLGLPDDRPEDWAELGLTLGGVITTIDPALALGAPEWGATSLTVPDPDELAPGLCSGRVRRRGIDTLRAERLSALAHRDVVREGDEEWVWAATGAVALGSAPAVPAGRLVPAVFHAWWGRRPEDPAPEGPRLRVASRHPDRFLANELAASLPAGWSTAATAPDRAVGTPPAWADATSLREALAEVALLLEPWWVLLRDPDVLWLPMPPDEADGLRVTPTAGQGVLVEGPYAHLERLLDLEPAGRT